MSPRPTNPIGMGLTDDQGYARPPYDRLKLDYAIVLDGEIDMLMDDTEIHLRPATFWYSRNEPRLGQQ